MEIINVQQGTPEWLALRATKFTASEAPAAMGESKYQSRDELLKLKATGIAPEVSSYQETIFAKGHAAEESARPLVENIIGDELYPATAISDEFDWMLASFDGITMLEDVVFEHKLFNKKLYERVLSNDLEPHYFWQLEQQLLVSGAEKAIFVCSDGTPDNFASCEYVSIPERREKLIAGWLQFQSDLSSYTVTIDSPVIEAEPVRDLPAVTYQMNGLTLNSNLDVFRAAAVELVEKSKQPIETDQDFADAEQLVKVFKGAEDKIKNLSEQVLGEVQSIDAFVKDLKFIGEKIRQARLATDKQVKTRKEEIRKQILTDANAKIQQHAAELAREIKAIMPAPSVSVLDAMKGKKTVKSLEVAAETAISQALVELDLIANKAKVNLVQLGMHAEYQFLMNDWATICFKDADDFSALLTSRIAIHKEAEAKRLEEERARIRAEEEAKAQREALAKIRQQQEAETKQLNEPEPERSPAITAALGKGKTAFEQVASNPALATSQIKPIQMVQITAKEASYLRKRDAILTALESAGVENWSGYEYAISTLSETAA
ncbi:lambda-exonuclease family protein [Photobacterium nomapromontoriensis]|uniref:lambda-exonuclease family protein n=1 Tax=Photobacterium nomapromontoriensis TaxID=2910237 RepID=UPI003D141D62